MKEETIAVEGIGRIDELVRSDADLLRLYIEYTRLLSDLRFGLTNERIDQTLHGLFGTNDSEAEDTNWSAGSWQRPPSFAGPLDAPSLRPLSYFGSAIQNTFAPISSGWPMAYLIATLVVGIGMLVGAFTYISQPVHVANRIRPAIQESTTPFQTRERVTVGRITGMADCRWEHKETALACNDRVSLGQKYVLASGLLEITYQTGARVILQGPVTYEVESKNGGYLFVGKLTGKVTTEAARGLTINTPTATITDLGTEFGVEVDSRGATSSHTFRGETEVVVHPSNGRPEATLRLKASQSVMIDASGKVSRRQRVDSQRFVRQLPPSPFESVPGVSQGTVAFDELFNVESKTPAIDYPELRFTPDGIGLGKSTAANASVFQGVLRIQRDRVTAQGSAFAAETDKVMSAKKFAGPLVVSVDISADSQNCGDSHVALAVGDMAFLFHPGHCTRQGIRGLFYISKPGALVSPPTDLGFVPDVDVLHHMFVYYDGKETFQFQLIDGLNPRNVFRTTYRDIGRKVEPIPVGVYRSGHPNVGMFDNLRVLQLPVADSSPDKTATETGSLTHTPKDFEKK
jgi:hypothetical protein